RVAGEGEPYEPRAERWIVPEEVVSGQYSDTDVGKQRHYVHGRHVGGVDLDPLHAHFYLTRHRYEHRLPQCATQLLPVEQDRPAAADVQGRALNVEYVLVQQEKHERADVEQYVVVDL